MGTNPTANENPDRNPPATPVARPRESAGASDRIRGGLSGMMQAPAHFVQEKATLLWWLHSAYALLFGIGIIWLSSRNFYYLRIIIFHITFIWLSSLFLPALANRSGLTPRWRERLRLLINYFNRNFYQQLLFFLLPIYYASTTFGSRNMWFLILLTGSAILSTLDIIYDRYLSVRWSLASLFFMFNLFATINVMLPVLWAIGNYHALWISGFLALAGFASMLYRLSGVHGHTARMRLVAAAVLLLVILENLPPYIPPAPLYLAKAEFGRTVRSLAIVDPLAAIPSSPGRIAVLTAIKAPMGLQEKVRHRWYLDDKEIFASNYFQVTGGRQEGYRLWTQITYKDDRAGRALVVDVETQGGQLIGRARLAR